MLPRSKRLDRNSFGIIATGKRAVSAHFSVSAAASRHGRAAAVVSKKVAKSSVDRHRVKRRILAAAAPYVRDGRSFIVYARAGSPSLPYAALHAELASLLASI